MKEVVKKEVFKLSDAGIVYAIVDSKWASLVQVVLKKGRINIEENSTNKLILIRLVNVWSACIDY